MKRSILSFVSVAIVSFQSAVGAEAKSDDNTDTVFMYAFAGVNPLAGKDSYGLILDYLMDRADRKSDPDADILFDELAKTTPTDRFTPTLACIFRSEDGSCPEIQFLAEDPFLSDSGRDSFHQELLGRGLSKARLIIFTEQAFQAGYAIHAQLHEISVTDEGFAREASVLTSFDKPFNKTTDAASRGLSVKDRRATPKLGSKEARALWWKSGEPPRIQRLTTEGLQSIVDLFTVGYALVEGKTADEVKENAKMYKRVRELDYPEGEKCRAHRSICNARALQFDGERVVIASISQRGMFIFYSRFESLY